MLPLLKSDPHCLRHIMHHCSAISATAELLNRLWSSVSGSVYYVAVLCFCINVDVDHNVNFILLFILLILLELCVCVDGFLPLFTVNH